MNYRKVISSVLALSLLVGTASFSYAEETTTEHSNSPAEISLPKDFIGSHAPETSDTNPSETQISSDGNSSNPNSQIQNPSGDPSADNNIPSSIPENPKENGLPANLEIIDSLDDGYYNPPTLKVISLGKGSSNYSSSSSSRKFNIKKAAGALNGKMLQPGEIFDFNKVVGPTSKSTGYKNAKVIVDGDFVDGYGGGVCQVSSTLFNAVLNSGMDIVQRRNHSLKISYLPAGYDAAVSYGALNFKFKNTYKVPVKIKTTANNSTLTIELVALQDTPKRVVSLNRSKSGNTYTVYRTIKENNQIIKKDSFRSTYGERKKKSKQ